MVKKTYVLLLLATVLTTMLGTVNCDDGDDDDSCADNMDYEDCGTACPTTCQDIADMVDLKARVCKEPCKKGCFCEDEYVLKGDGTCVRREACPCKTNAHYRNCGGCHITCEDVAKNATVKPCTKECKEGGCFCNDGYVLNGTECVLEKACRR